MAARVRSTTLEPITHPFAFTRLGRNVRALDEHEQIVSTLRSRDLTTVQHLLHAHLLRFYENVTPLLPVLSEIADPPADA
jgi:DNA-binding GntR family transcriptional regulator